MERITPDPVDALTVTTLVDNVSDILLTDDGPAKRAPFKLATTGNVLRAEHGFSSLVSITKGDGRPGSSSTPGSLPTGWSRT